MDECRLLFDSLFFMDVLLIASLKAGDIRWLSCFWWYLVWLWEGPGCVVLMLHLLDWSLPSEDAKGDISNPHALRGSCNLLT